MTSLLNIAWASAWHRRFALSLVVLCLALSTFLLLTVERVRHDVRENFSNAVSGTDLIVGARSGAVQLMLYSVFRMGQPTQTIEYATVQALRQDPAVKWVVPLALGDTHRGFPVVATTPEYFEHFRYGPRLPLALREGRRFEGVFEAVLGADVARQLGYTLGQRLVLRHGSGTLDTADHADMPFTVVGILARTGTPVDRSVHIGLQGMQALHIDWMAGMPVPGAGLMAVVMTALEQRRRELAVLRSVGAGPRWVFMLLLVEGLLISLTGAALGGLAWALALWAGAPWVQAAYGIILTSGLPTLAEVALAAAVVLAGVVSSLWPGWRAYRLSLADGLTPRGT
ncbi:MAG: ABC transporter permease [Betaproteobacteria bacterium]|nr:ABC transporter permease [Betaproteobacteria bacterium]